ncbi:serine hydrolase-like protein [Leptotrombidium deliense]|uniref:Serine hydrolase-like protein n=1 Tax=Leptotrombidium deliense TaxID=299467 RepID=A0A443S734_9ACAR|nr:serine hydrolase-like protein [Leptotrombidium deliense]
MEQNWREEIVEVPYGQIACKVWRKGTDNENCCKIIAIHGWQDNAGTFDCLIPLLNFDCVVVAVDMPGHGLSSHLPNGILYTDCNYLLDIKRVIDHFGWTKISFMGHSMGGMIALYFASVFPDEVEFIICLDVLKPLTCEATKIAESIQTTLNTFINVEKKILSPRTQTYTFAEATRRLIEAHSLFGLITEESAQILLKRGASKTEGNCYVFNRDLRLRSLLFTRQTDETLISYFSRLKCNLLVIIAEKGVKHDDDEVQKKFLKVYSEYAKRFKFVAIDGEHHIHLNNASAVVPYINDFIFDCYLKNGDVHNGV